MKSSQVQNLSVNCKTFLLDCRPWRLLMTCKAKHLLSRAFACPTVCLHLNLDWSTSLLVYESSSSRHSAPQTVKGRLNAWRYTMTILRNMQDFLESMTYSCAGLTLHHPCAIHRLPELCLPERLTKLVNLKPLTIVITPNVRACLTSSPLEGSSFWTVSLHSPLASMVRNWCLYPLERIADCRRGKIAGLGLPWEAWRIGKASICPPKDCRVSSSFSA